MNIREVSVARLKEYENNPRNNDLAVEKVKYSITRFGFLFPIVIDMNYTIVCGHTRVRACRELGIQTVPCVIADELSDEQINLFRLVDNKTSEYSDWDYETLKNELALVDLTVEGNQLLLDQFELSAEVFEIDAEQAEIKVPAFNFMPEAFHAKRDKPVVKTIRNAKENNRPAAERVDEDFEEREGPAVEDQVASASLEGAKPESIGDESAWGEQTAKEERPSSGATRYCQFRFGDVSFFISQIEQDRLTARYSEYMDSGAALSESFVAYLLKGVSKDA